VKEVNAEKLRCEFDDISFKSGECIEEFALHISGLANQLRSLGDNVPDKKVVRKMLQSVLDNLEQVATETLLDLDSLLIEEVVGHLQVVENRRKKKTMSLAKDGGGQLLLTGEQWKAKYMASSGEKSGEHGNGGGGGHGHGHGSGCGDSGSSSCERQEDFGGPDGPVEKCCFRCGKPSHFACDYQAKKKSDQGQANLAQEELSALLHVEREAVCFDLPPYEGEEISKPSTPHSNSLLTVATGVAGLFTTTLGLVHLLEERVFA
jgi:hypothetical protein